MKTFNNKPQHKNVLAVIFGMVGILILFIAWLYHVLIQLITMPRSEWLNPFNKKTWLVDYNYPTKFCFYFCNVEATMLNHLSILRLGFGVGYCNE